MADKGDPRDSGTGTGREEDDGVARRWWPLQRVQRYYDVLLARAYLAVPSIEAIAAATGNGDGHGRLRRGDGVAALMGDPTSISGIHRT